MRKRIVLELCSVIIILLIGISVLFGDVLFQGKVLVPADLLFNDPLLREVLSSPGINNYLLADHLHQFYVWHYLAARSMQTTYHIPLWNPYFLAGQPLIANAQPALFYLPNLLLFWLDPATVANIRIFFNIVVAGVFTFLFGRVVQISYPGALLAAIAFAFSGPLMVGPGHAYANCLVWLPFIMWTGENILRSPRIYVWGLITSIGVGLSIVGGHPESSFHNLLIFGAYFVARLLISYRFGHELARYSSAFVLAGGVGLLLGAIQILPFAQHLFQSAFTSRSRSWLVDSLVYTKEWLPNLSTLVTLLYPNFFGNPVDNTYSWPFSNYQNYLEQAMYFGLLPMALASGVALNLTRNQRRYIVTILTVLAVLTLFVALRLPGFEGINYLPILRKINNTRFKWYFAFLGAVLAGFGLDALSYYFNFRDQKYKRVIYVSTVVLGMAWLILGVIGACKYLITPFLTIPADTFYSHLLFSIFSFAQPKIAVSIFVIVIMPFLYWMFCYKFKGYAAVKWIIISLTFLELIVQAKGYNTMVTREMLFPEPPLIRQLKQDQDVFRIMGIPPVLWPNYGAVYGLFHVGGYDLPVFKLSADLYLAQGGEGYRQTWRPDWPLVDWMNVKYIFSDQALSLEKLELVADNGVYKLYQNTAVLPRAYMVYDVQVISDDNLRLKALTSGDFDFRHTALLGENPPFMQNKPELSLDDTQKFKVDFLQYTNDRIDLRVTTPKPGLLVTSELYTPDWKVLVDGQNAEVLCANYAFRAVYIPDGEHHIKFSYKPWAFAWGCGLTIVGLFILLVGIPVAIRYANRKP